MIGFDQVLSHGLSQAKALGATNHPCSKQNLCARDGGGKECVARVDDGNVGLVDGGLGDADEGLVAGV